MGEALYRPVTEDEGYRCRIYAPVGHHRDLLAYLVRRLLENGANSSFVNQITDLQFSPEEIAADPVEMIENGGAGGSADARGRCSAERDSGIARRRDRRWVPALSPIRESRRCVSQAQPGPPGL